MKRTLLVLALLWVASAEALAVEAHEQLVMGPMTFTREKGKPVTETVPFTAAGGRAILKLSNDDVSSATVSINGMVVLDRFSFSRKRHDLREKIQLVEGENRLTVTLQSQPGSRITIEIVRMAVLATPEEVLSRTANALRAGNIDLALQGFYQDEKTRSILPGLDAAKRNQLADEIENATFVLERGRSRYYRYSWTDATGSNSVEYSMAINDEGNWIITSW